MSRGFSEESGETVEKMASDLAEMDSDFLSHTGSGRTLPGLITSTSTISSRDLSSMSKVYAQNYDSPIYSIPY